MKTITLSLIALLLFLINCSSEPETFTVETIDGVQTVHNLSAKWGDTPAIELSLVKQIGAFEGEDENYNFYMPLDLEKDSVGNIYVAEMGNVCIKKFDPSGKYLLTIGKKGQGPGELGFTQRINIVDNNLYVLDLGNRKMEKFDLDGNYINTERMDTPYTDFKKLQSDFFIRSSISIGNQEATDLLSKTDLKGNITKSFGELKDLGDPWYNSLGNENVFDINSKNEILIAYKRRNTIEKYSSEGSLISKTDRPLAFEPLESPILREYPLPGGRTRSIPVMSMITGEISIDHKDRIWLLTYVVDMINDADQIDDATILTELQVLNNDGHFLGSIPLTKNYLRIRIHEDRLYLFEISKEMVVYEYLIIDN